eukprot:243684-Chlamydomonas_euryale.AAC.2
MPPKPHPNCPPVQGEDMRRTSPFGVRINKVQHRSAIDTGLPVTDAACARPLSTSRCDPLTCKDLRNGERVSSARLQQSLPSSNHIPLDYPCSMVRQYPAAPILATSLENKASE